VATKAIAQARENLRLVNNKYRQNVASSTDVVDAETSLTKARSNYHIAIYDCHTALARLVSAAGLSREDAIVEGILTKMRPMLLTAIVAVAGMLPMAISKGVGAEMRAPIALAVDHAVGAQQNGPLDTIFRLADVGRGIL